MKRICALIGAAGLVLGLVAPASPAVAEPARNPAPQAIPSCTFGFLYSFNGRAVGGKSRCYNVDSHHVRVGCGNGVTFILYRDGVLAESGQWSARLCPSSAPLAHWVSYRYYT